MVPIGHRQRRINARCGVQWRLSFSTAETLLLNSWTPLQQIVYHMLRSVVKAKIYDCVENQIDNDGGGAGYVRPSVQSKMLNNYHMKTLMMWTCELRPDQWWSPMKLVAICAALLKTLATWLTEGNCRHYFLDDCNLFMFQKDGTDECQLHSLALVKKLKSLASVRRLGAWFLRNYIGRFVRKELPKNVAEFGFDSIVDRSDITMDVIVRLRTSLERLIAWINSEFRMMQNCSFIYKNLIFLITTYAHKYCHDVRTYLACRHEVIKLDRRFMECQLAAVYLHVALALDRGSEPEISSLFAVLDAAVERHGIATASRNAESSCSSHPQQQQQQQQQQPPTAIISADMCQAYMDIAMRHRRDDVVDSNGDKQYASCNCSCSVRVYMAVLHYVAGNFERAVEGCAAVTKFHKGNTCTANCNSIVEVRLLPKIDDAVDIASGLAVFFAYTRQTATKETTQFPYGSAGRFSAASFARYIRTRCCLKSEDPTKSLADCLQRYGTTLQKEATHDEAADWLLYLLLINDVRRASNMLLERSVLQSLKSDRDRLRRSLLSFAVDHMTVFQRSIVEDFGPSSFSFVNIYKALYLFSCGRYEDCYRMCESSLNNLFQLKYIDYISAVPLVLLLADSTLTSLVGLMFLVEPKTILGGQDTTISQPVLLQSLCVLCGLKMGDPFSTIIGRMRVAHVVFHRAAKSTLDQLLLTFVCRKSIRYFVCSRTAFVPSRHTISINNKKLSTNVCWMFVNFVVQCRINGISLPWEGLHSSTIESDGSTCLI